MLNKLVNEIIEFVEGSNADKFIISLEEIEDGYSSGLVVYNGPDSYEYLINSLDASKFFLNQFIIEGNGYGEAVAVYPFDVIESTNYRMKRNSLMDNRSFIPKIINRKQLLGWLENKSDSIFLSTLQNTFEDKYEQSESE